MEEGGERGGEGGEEEGGGGEEEETVKREKKKFKFNNAYRTVATAAFKHGKTDVFMIEYSSTHTHKGRPFSIPQVLNWLENSVSLRKLF